MQKIRKQTKVKSNALDANLLNANAYSGLFNHKLTKGELTQIQIAEKGIRILAEHGLTDFTLDKVAKKMKTTRSHLVYHFQTGEGLLLFMLRYIIMTAERLTVDGVEKAKNDEEFIAAIICGGMKWFELYPDHAKCWVSFFDLAIRNSDFKKINHQMRTEGLQRLIHHLKKTRPELSSARAISIARSVQSLMAGEIINYFSTEPEMSYHQLTQETVANAQKIFNLK